MHIRPARPEDAFEMAQLVNIASEGLALHFWREACGGKDPLEYGVSRAVREEGSFSYRNGTVIEDNGKVMSLLIGYRQPNRFEPLNLSDFSALIRPLVELEAFAPRSWYVNVLATFPEHRGKGLGSRLLAEAERLARESAANGLSLIAAEENLDAVRLYERTGYAKRERRPLAPYPGCPHGGDWVLMTKPLEG
jgi:ribosomal protein S18 acetylase RimI-like enzyme